MKREKLNIALLLVTGLFFILLGILFLFRAKFIWQFIYTLVLIGFIGLGCVQLLSLLKSKTKIIKWNTIFSALVCFGFSFYIFLNPTKFFAFIPYVFGWWALLNSIIRMITYYVYKRDRLRNRFWILCDALITLTFALVLILNPLRHIIILSYLAGAYLIFYGTVQMIEFNKEVIPSSITKAFKNHTRFGTPVILSAFIPRQVYSSISDLIKQHKLDPLEDVRSNDDIEIFIYMKPKGPESLGHMDISYKGTIYSYGCHDPSHRGLNGTLGDGVLIIAPRDSFLSNAIQKENKTIVSFTINLNDDQKKIVERRIDELKARLVPWYPDAYLLEHNQPIVGTGVDYASRVYKEVKANFYKFKEGKFKTYFVFSTNCVLLGDYLLRCNELDLMNINGIVTPGTYLDFLNTEYLHTNSVVRSRTIYMKQ